MSVSAGICSALTSVGLAGPMLVSARSMGMCAMAPVFSSSCIPGRLRFAVALVMALPAFGLSSVRSVSLDCGAAGLLALVATELLLGAVIGLSAWIVVEGFRLAGSLVDTGAGLGWAAGAGGSGFSDPEDGGGKGPVAVFARAVALLVFVVSGGPAMMAAACSASCAAFPPGAVLGGLRSASPGAAVKPGHWLSVIGWMGASLLEGALRLALPALFAFFAYRFATALLASWVPALAEAAGDLSARTLVAIALGVLMVFAGMGGIMPSIGSSLAELGIDGCARCGACCARTGGSR